MAVSLIFHDNNLKNDAGKMLNTLFSLTNIKFKHLTLNNNAILRGNLENWNTPAPSELETLSLHGCDIRGRLADKSLLSSNVKYITMYTNHLSCGIKQDFLNTTSTNVTSLVLLQNLFKIDNIKKTKLLTNEPFTSATRLYMASDNIRDILDILVLVGSGIIIIVCLTSKIIKLVKHVSKLRLKTRNCNGCNYYCNYGDDSHNLDKYTLNNRKNYTIGNSDLYNNLWSMFSHWSLLLSGIMLTLLYYQVSYYYKCGYILSTFGMIYYYDKDIGSTDAVIAIQILISICIVAFYTHVVLYLNFAIKTSKTASVNSKRDLPNPFRKKSASISSQESSVELEASILQLNQHEDIRQSIDQARVLVNSKNKFASKGKTIICCLLLTSIYIIGNVLSIAYITMETLPKDNIFDLNVDGLFGQITKYSMGAVISLIRVFIVPSMIDHILFICRLNSYQQRKYGSYCILLFRSLISIIFPLLFAFTLLPDCGNNWTKFWNPCKKNTAYFKYLAQIDANYLFDLSWDIELSSYDYVCQANNLNQMFDNNGLRLNTCLREFFDLWLPIITIKLIYFIVNPFLVYFVKKYQIDLRIYNKLVKNDFKCCQCCEGYIEKTKNETIAFDAEYASIATKLDIFFIFMPFAPFILPLIILALFNYFIVFSWITNDLKHQIVGCKISQITMKKHEEHNIQFWVHFPFYALFFSMILGQLLFIAFSIHIFESWLIMTVIILLVTLDCAWIVAQMC